jgi:hypothetical protein
MPSEVLSAISSDWLRRPNERADHRKWSAGK